MPKKKKRKIGTLSKNGKKLWVGDRWVAVDTWDGNDGTPFDDGSWHNDQPVEPFAGYNQIAALSGLASGDLSVIQQVRQVKREGRRRSSLGRGHDWDPDW